MERKAGGWGWELDLGASDDSSCSDTKIMFKTQALISPLSTN